MGLFTDSSTIEEVEILYSSGILSAFASKPKSPVSGFVLATDGQIGNKLYLYADLISRLFLLSNQPNRDN